MSNYWLKDAGGQVLGPIGPSVLRSMATRLQTGTPMQASTDGGTTWLPWQQLPEVAEVLLPPALAARRSREQQEAARLDAEVQRLRELPAHVLFDVPPEADATTFRQAFLQKARPYHPSQLPAGAHPELVRSSLAMFQFLAGALTRAAPGARVSGLTPPPIPAHELGLAGLPRAVPPSEAAHAADAPRATPSREEDGGSR